MVPSEIRMTGLPHSSRRKEINRMEATAKISWTPKTVKMGTKPDRRGMPLSCMGMDARLAMSMVTTNSAGSISPICRFPMSRTTKMRIRYKKMVLK